MPSGPTSIHEARDLPGLRLISLNGLPSPWSQAARGIFHVKRLDYTIAHRDFIYGEFLELPVPL